MAIMDGDKVQLFWNCTCKRKCMDAKMQSITSLLMRTLYVGYSWTTYISKIVYLERGWLFCIHLIESIDLCTPALMPLEFQ